MSGGLDVTAQVSSTLRMIFIAPIALCQHIDLIDANKPLKDMARQKRKGADDDSIG